MTTSGQSVDSIDASDSSVSEWFRQSADFIKIWGLSVGVYVAIGFGTFALSWWLTLSPGGAQTLGVSAGVANVFAIGTVVVLSGTIDRTDRYRFMVKTLLVLLGALALLAAVFLVDNTSVAVVMALIASFVAMEAVYSVYGAALETTLADLAPDIWPSTRVASLVTVPPLLARLVAPLFGGIFIASEQLWSIPILGVVLVVGSIGLLALWRGSLAGIQLAEPGPRTAGRTGPTEMIRVSVGDVREAWRWIRERPILVYMVLIGVLGNLIVFPFVTLLPAYLSELKLEESTTARLYGEASSAYGAGLMVSTFAFSGLARRVKRPAAVVSLNMLAIVAVLGILSASSDETVIRGAMFGLGLLFIGLVAVAGGTWLDMTPPEMRARVFSVRRFVMFLSIPVGTSSMGFLGAALGFSIWLRILLALVIGLLLVFWAWLTLALRRQGEERTPAGGTRSNDDERRNPEVE